MGGLSLGVLKALVMQYFVGVSVTVYLIAQVAESESSKLSSESRSPHFVGGLARVPELLSVRP